VNQGSSIIFHCRLHCSRPGTVLLLKASMTEDQRQAYNPACCTGFGEGPTAEKRIVPSESCSGLILSLSHPSA